MFCVAVYCSVLVCSNVLLCGVVRAICCVLLEQNTVSARALMFCAAVRCSALRCDAVCDAVCCRVLQCVALRCSTLCLPCVVGVEHQICSSTEFLCCSALQCAAVCCSVLQHVAVCCSVLQVCCSVLQRTLPAVCRLSRTPDLPQHSCPLCRLVLFTRKR